MNISSIFLGAAPSKCRPFLFAAFKHLLGRYDRLYVPCVGNFTVPQIAARAGWSPERIFCSDIFKKIIEKTGSQSAAEIFILMKTLQLNPSKRYELGFIEELEKHASTYRDRLNATIAEIQKTLKGMHFQAMDLREDIKQHQDDDRGVFWLNPPYFKGGYSKLFLFQNSFDWRACPAPEYDWKKEYPEMLAGAMDAKALMLVYNAGAPIKERDSQTVFIIEKDYGHRETMLCNRADEIPDRLKTFSVRKELNLRPLPYPIFGEDDIITPDSVIDWIPAKAENALYYRNLWLHKLGQTNAEEHAVWFIDGKLFAVCGFHCSDINRLRSSYIFENYGFTVSSKHYKNLCRLLMMCLTSMDTRRKIITRLKIASKNPLVEIKGLSTTCLSKYRKVKLNNGISRN